MKKYDIAIIGGGPAGLYAYYLAKKNKLDVCLLEANNALGGQPAILFPVKLIHDYPEYKEIMANDLVNVFIKQIKDKKDIYLNISVNGISKADNGYELLTSNSERVNAKYVIIATGGGFFKFNKIDGLDFESTHYRVQDLKTYKNKKVVICGGGDSAIDWTWELLTNNITEDISLVHRRDEFRAKGAKLETVTHSCVKVYLDKTSKVVADGKLQIVDNKTSKVDVLPYDYLLVFYGQSYSLLDNNILKPFILDSINRIMVDIKCETNLKNIYAIGNVSSFENKPKLIHVAVSDAKKAIEDITRKIK